MKKLMIMMLTLLSCGAAYALPVGNPADPSLLNDGLILANEEFYDSTDYWSMGSIRLGYQGDFVFNNNLEISNSSDDNIESSELYTNSALIVLNVLDRLDLYTTIGASSARIDTNASHFGFTGTGRLELETESDLSWTAGVRATIIECGCTTVGVDAKYFRARPDVKRITLNGDTSTYPDNSLDLRIRQYQASLAIAHRINNIVPYVAVKLNKTKYDFNHKATPIGGSSVRLHNLANRHNVGFAVGATLVDCERVSLNVEGRFYDENALTVNAQFRF